MRHGLWVCIGLAISTLAAAGDVVPIASGVDLIPGAFVPNRQPDGNSVIFRAPDGLVVMDTGRHVEHTQRILNYAKGAGVPITAVVSSHWHLDHVSGNPLVRAAYPSVTVYASDAIEDAMGGFLADYRKQLEDAIVKSKDAQQTEAWRAEVATIDSGRALYPDVKIARTEKLRIAGKEFVVHFTPHAATAGDVWLFDPASQTIAGGDLVTLPVPFLDTACPAGWKAALDDVAHADFKVLVPGHGAPMHRRQFETYRRAFDNLVACAASAKTKATCSDGWLADAKPLLADVEPHFVANLLDYYIDNALRAPKAQLEKLCGDRAATNH